MLTPSQNFDYLADMGVMGVPSDIPEPVTDTDRRDNGMDMNMEYYKQPIYSLSYRVMEMLPYTKAVRPRPSSILIQLTVQAVVPGKAEAD